MKTHITDVSLVDLLVVAKSLADEEIAQLEAFTGEAFSTEKLAMQIFGTEGIKWTCRVIETGEPIVVAGLFQVGKSTWRTFMVPGDRTWAEFGEEVTKHTVDVLADVADSGPFIRIETICLQGRDKVTDWYEKIGLEYESTLRSYGVEGENAVMYVKTGNGQSGIIERV